MSTSILTCLLNAGRLSPATQEDLVRWDKPADAIGRLASPGTKSQTSTSAYSCRWPPMHKLRRLLGLAAQPMRTRQDPAVNVHCQEFEVNNWLVSEFVLKTLVPIVGTHPFPLNELVLMVAAVCRLK